MAQKAKNDINLLPQEFRYGLFKRIAFYYEAHTKVCLVYIAAGLVLVFSAASSAQAMFTNVYLKKTKEAEESVYRLQAKYKEAEGMANQLNQAKEALGFQISLINKRIEFLKRQYRFGHWWATNLRALKMLVPDGVWIIGIKTEDHYMKVWGGAFGEELVSQFMVNLRKSPMFNNVSFDYTQKSMVGETKTVLFEVTCGCAAQSSNA